MTSKIPFDINWPLLLHTIGRNDLVCGYIIGILLNIDEINDCMSFFVTQSNFIFFTICTHLLHANLDDIIHKSFLWSLDISCERNFRSNCLWIGKASKVENILKGILDLIPWGVKAKVCWHHPAMFCLDTSSKLSRL